MAAEISEISEITEGNRDLHAEVHEILRMVLEMHAVLARFRPLLDQLGTSPAATARAVRKGMRRAVP